MPTKSTAYNAILTPYWSGYSSGSNIVSAATRDWYRTWTTTPGYSKKKRNFEELPTNEMSESAFDRRHEIGSVRMDKWVGGANPIISITSNFYAGHWLPPQQILPTAGHAALFNKCVAKLPKKINGSQFNSLVFLAELKKTRAMVTNLAKDIALQFSRMQRSRVSDLSQLSNREYRSRHGFSKQKFRSDSGLSANSGLSKREAQNVWLEYRYGWRLLVKDIQDLLQSVHDRRTARPVFRVKATAFEVSTSKFSVNHLQLTDRYEGSGLVLNDLSVDRIYREDVTISIRYRDTTPLLGTLQQYGITNPVLLVWELIPYSFVFDWLIPVGDYLSTIDTFIGKEFVSGSVSYITYDAVVSTPSNVRGNPTYAGWVVGNNRTKPCSSTRRFYKRMRLTSFPSASLPSLDLNLNSSRVIDAISLVTQKLRR